MKWFKQEGMNLGENNMNLSTNEASWVYTGIICIMHEFIVFICLWPKFSGDNQSHNCEGLSFIISAFKEP